MLAACRSGEAAAFGSGSRRDAIARDGCSGWNACRVESSGRSGAGLSRGSQVSSSDGVCESREAASG